MPSCDECAAYPELKEKRGCSKPSTAVVWEDDEDEYWFCPLSMIHAYVRLWHDSYVYADQFGGVPFDKQSARWVEAALYYRYRLNAHREFFKPRQQSHGLGALKGALNG